MATRPRGGQVFEDFKPISEWKQNDDEDSHNLIIYLPGFTKDQIRVSTEGRNMIRVRGERLAAGNNWSRFLEDFQVPENSEMNSIRAKLHGGILYITVPKKSVITKQPQEGTTPTPKQTTTPQKDQSRDEETLKTQKPSEDNNNDVDDDDAEKRKRSDELLKEEHTPQKRGDNVIKKTVDKEEKNLKTNDGANEEDKVSKGKQVKESRPSDYGAFAVGRRYKKAVEGIGDLSKEQKLLVNIGVAVLVIVGISAYATYKFASAKDKN